MLQNPQTAMPTIDLTDAELAAVTAAIRRAIEQDRFPRAPRLDPLRSALAKLDPATPLKLQPHPNPNPPPARADKAGAAIGPSARTMKWPRSRGDVDGADAIR